MGIFQAKGNGDFSKLTFIRLGGWGGAGDLLPYFFSNNWPQAVAS